MIIDLNAFTGTWPFNPIVGDLESVRSSLKKYGVDQMFVSPLEAAWCRNPHKFNDSIYDAAKAFDDVWPVPVLDPTVEPTERPTETPVPTEVLTATPLPTATPTEIPTPTPKPTETSVPTFPPTLLPTATPQPTVELPPDLQVTPDSG